MPGGNLIRHAVPRCRSRCRRVCVAGIWFAPDGRAASSAEGGDVWFSEKVIPVGDERRILLTTECLQDGSWAVVASILEATPNGERVVDLPVGDERFTTEADAEASGRNSSEGLDRAETSRARLSYSARAIIAIAAGFSSDERSPGSRPR